MHEGAKYRRRGRHRKRNTEVGREGVRGKCNKRDIKGGKNREGNTRRARESEREKERKKSTPV